MKTYKLHGGEITDTTQLFMVNPEAYWKARSERAEAKLAEAEARAENAEALIAHLRAVAIHTSQGNAIVPSNVLRVVNNE